VNGETRDILPVGAEALAICEPDYEEHPGWKESTVGVKAFDASCPRNAQQYLRRLEAWWRRPWRSSPPAPIARKRSCSKHPFE
jgi:adenylosuccinate synthase